MCVCVCGAGRQRGVRMLEFVLTLLLVFLSLLLFLSHSGRTWRQGEPPLVRASLPFVGKALEFGRDTLALLTRLQHTHGDVFTVLIAGRYMTFVMNPLFYPAVVKHGRQLDFHAFSDRVAPPAFGYPPTRSGAYPGLPNHIQNSFQLLQGDRLALLSKSMLGNLLAALRHHLLCDEQGAGPGAWRQAGLHELCERLMFRASLLTLYGTHAQTHSPGAVEELRGKFSAFDAWFPLLVGGLPIGLLGRAKARRGELIHHFHPQSMQQWNHTSDFVRTRTQLLDRYPLTDAQKGAHHFAILWASVGNTIPAAFWVVYHLLAYPEAFAAVKSEIQEVLGIQGEGLALNDDIIITPKEMDRMIYLESAVRESLRLSSASMNVRVAQEDLELRLDSQHSVRLRKDDFIVLYPQSMHMDPEIYPQPEVYRFDRFVSGGDRRVDFFKRGQKLHYFLMPFGSGVSKCPGRFFALAELKQLVCVLLLYCQLELTHTHTHTPPVLETSRAGLGILPPKQEVFVRYKPIREERNEGQGEREGVREREEDKELLETRRLVSQPEE